VIIDRVEPPGLIAGADWIGRRLDINWTGLGKALVAFLSEERFSQLITGKRFAKHNDNTIVSIKALRRELAKVRELDYAIDDGEDGIGLRCVGAPVFDGSRRVIAAISAAGTTEQIPIDRIRTLAVVVKQAAAEISSHLRIPSC
jgi:DNA-binding IclR family transcriptional regulator